MLGGVAEENLESVENGGDSEKKTVPRPKGLMRANIGQVGDVRYGFRSCRAWAIVGYVRYLEPRIRDASLNAKCEA